MWAKCNKKEGFLSMYCNVCLCAHIIQWEEEEELSLCECTVYCFGSSCLCGRSRRGRKGSLFKEKQPGALRLPQVFYNQGLSSLCRCVSYVRAGQRSVSLEYQTCTSAYLFDTLVTGKVTVATRVSDAERGALSTAFAMITDWVVPSGRAGRPRILASWWR